MSLFNHGTFDSLQPINRRFLTTRVGALSPVRRGDVCRALRSLADC